VYARVSAIIDVKNQSSEIGTPINSKIKPFNIKSASFVILTIMEEFQTKSLGHDQKYLKDNPGLAYLRGV
jgi:hypothetical protein